MPVAPVRSARIMAAGRFHLRPLGSRVFHPLIDTWSAKSSASLPNRSGWAGLDRRRPQHADRRAHRIGQDTCRVFILYRSAAQGRPGRRPARCHAVVHLAAQGAEQRYPPQSGNAASGTDRSALQPGTTCRSFARLCAPATPRPAAAGNAPPTAAHPGDHARILYLLLTGAKAARCSARSARDCGRKSTPWPATSGNAPGAVARKAESAVSQPPVRIGLRPRNRRRRNRPLPGGQSPAGRWPPDCTIIDAGHLRTLDLNVEVPPQNLSAVCSQECWSRDLRPAGRADRRSPQHAGVVNTRRLRAGHASSLGTLGEDAVASPTVASRGSCGYRPRAVEEWRAEGDRGHRITGDGN